MPCERRGDLGNIRADFGLKAQEPRIIWAFGLLSMKSEQRECVAEGKMEAKRVRHQQHHSGH